uniref:HSF-type DNA-binding domain-containing protein n=1 Tax=Amphiprion ocellaris TaxID=80972 RepID=A0A3Q1BSJ8_AMPOC
MDAGENPLPDSINPNNFPAKLWRLVNSPANEAICWDSLGEVIVIDQQRFERQVLSPGSMSPNSPDAFKTTNFSSFVRQLNLYGFKKVEQDVTLPKLGNSTFHYFYNASFKRSHPELVARLRRLTVDNKAKLQAGLDVNCRPPCRYQRVSGSEHNRGPSLLSPSHQQSTHPYYPSKTQATKALNGTPVPPRYLMRGLGAAFSPTNSEKAAFVGQAYAGVTSSPNAVSMQQGLLPYANQGNPNFTGFNPHNAPYQPGFYSPVFHCYYPNPVGPHMAGGGLQRRMLSPQGYYQAGPPVNMFCQDLQSKENQEVKKSDTSLDAIFQMADEVMQTPPSRCLVKVKIPEKPVSELEPSSNTCNPKSSDNSMKANPLGAEPILMAVSNYPHLTTYKQEEQCLVSVPEQMPDDAIFEVSVFSLDFLKALGCIFN